jgi:lipopolysaccharide transport system ATP-binding protein
MADALVVRGLSKRFRRYHPGRPTTLQELFLNGLRWWKSAEVFWALRNVSFSLAPGRTLGVIGANGAGKSTLLRLIGGIGRPDQGTVELIGRIGALLDLGTGFHPDLTGRENVFVAGVIAGLTRKEVAQRLDSIVAFSELEEFIEYPLRTYSSGMQLRLAFAVAVHIEPEVLLIDEVLAVGDLSFQRKCLDRIAEFKARGCTIVIVSHDSALIRELCDDALWLRAGRAVAYGAAETVVNQYMAEMTGETRRRTPVIWPALRTSTGAELRVKENRFGSMELEISSVQLLDCHGMVVTELDSGRPLCVEIDYHAPQPICAPIFGVTVTREDNLVCYDTTTESARLTLPTVHGQGRLTLFLERLDLIGGLYYFDVGAYEPNWSYAYDYHWHVYPLIICSAGREKGVLRPPHRWEFSAIQASHSKLRNNLDRVRINGDER